MKLDLADNHLCYVCGKDNPLGFKLEFKHPRQNLLTAEVVFSPHHQGFKDIVHGGIVSTLLDEMMVNLAWVEGIPAVTSELTVRLKKAVKVGERVFLEGVIDRREPRLLYASSTAKNSHGTVLATAEAKCLILKA